MPFIQITKCVAPADYHRDEATTADAFIKAFVISGITFTLIWILLGSLVGDFVASGVAVAVALCTFAAIFKDVINNKRLVCIEKDICTIGIVIPRTIEPPPGFPHIDNDFCFNLIPLPHNIEDDRLHVINDGHLGQFISDPDEITAIGLSTTDDLYHSNNIHCELEGDRPNVFADALCIAGVIIGAAIAASEVLIILFGWLGALAVAIIIGLAIAGVIAATFLLSHDGNAEDAADDIKSATISDWDVFVVKGDRVFEGAHFPGWNEIHPVKHLQKLWNEQKNPSHIIGNTNASIDASTFVWVQALVFRWCDAITEATNPTVLDAQNQPENQWTDHPAVDGCYAIPVIG